MDCVVTIQIQPTLGLLNWDFNYYYNGGECGVFDYWSSTVVSTSDGRGATPPSEGAEASRPGRQRCSNHR